MSRYHSYLNSAVSILNSYKGQEPFAIFLKKFFSANKKFGSKDRKFISHLCYCFFRNGKAFSTFAVEEKVLIGLFLNSNVQNDLLAFHKSEWNAKVELALTDKLALIDSNSLLQNIFPWIEECSAGLNEDLFINSFLIQPDLFIRIRKGKEKEVKIKLKNAGIDFRTLNNTCVVLLNTTKIDSLFEIDKEVVIQDHSSQRIAEFLPLNIDGTIKNVWDCCAASGGKSILANDVLGDIQLTVTDVREHILFNLIKRFSAAGIKNYKSFVADLSKSQKETSENYDLIIADVPCTGSGTWSRTPEQLYYFDTKKIGEYAALQRKISGNVIQQLKPGGYFLYITCSVFKIENEASVNAIIESAGLKLIKMELIKGYELKADTMFAALLQKPL